MQKVNNPAESTQSESGLSVVDSFNGGATSRPAILRPFIPDEAMRAKEAARYAGVHPATIGVWSKRHNIGRVISRDLYISKVALQALLEDDQVILHAYLAGDRESPAIRRLYARLGIPLSSPPLSTE